MTENTHENPYFDLITSGIGYLNRSRSVKPQQGSPYECVSIAALRGRSDSPSYSYFDCRIVGEQALLFIKSYKGDINERNTKVLVRFNVGDGEATSYELTQGENQGQRRHQIKSRLLKITWAKVGDQVIDLGLDDDSKATPADATTEAQQPPAEDNKPRSWEDTIGTVVKLSEDDPYYMRKMARLKALGYQWHSERQEWRKAA